MKNSMTNYAQTTPFSVYNNKHNKLYMNIAVVGHRGSGKTTLCHKLAGLDSPVHPGGTSTLNYVACKWDSQDVLIWDFVPGFTPESLTFLDDIHQVIVCVDGRRMESTLSCISALDHLFTGNVCVAVTKYTRFTVTLPLTLFDACHANVPLKVFYCGNQCCNLRNHVFSNNSA